MGLAALRSVLAPEPCSFAEVAGSTVAVDANNLLWTFVTGMARSGPPTGPHGRPISHVIGLVNRVRLYAEHDVTSVWVFDGEQPELKADTIADRQARIDAAKAAGDDVAATQLTRAQIVEARAVLDALGVPWLQAPSESDAQCAHFVRDGRADAAVTQDYDAALHGCPVTYRNLTSTGRRGPERMDLHAALTREGLTREQLVDAAILIGTDYNDGIKGVGPVTAVKLVRTHGDLFGALEARDVDMPRAADYRALFLDHPVDATARFEPRAPEPATVEKVLAEHGLSARRAGAVASAVSRLHG